MQDMPSFPAYVYHIKARSKQHRAKAEHRRILELYRAPKDRSDRQYTSKANKKESSIQLTKGPRASHISAGPERSEERIVAL